MKISPSILACDFSRLGEEVLSMEQAGADMIHIDVMDGHFVPNISLGIPVIQSLRGVSDIFFDVHLMISEPLRYIDAFAKAGADLITFHVEADSDIGQTIARIRETGTRVGISLKPGTGADAVLPWLHLVDLVLVMTVEPGFGGQSFLHEQMDKLAEIAQACRRLNRRMDIQVDGGIDLMTAPIAAKNGANVLVSGSALYGRPNYNRAVEELRSAAFS